MAHGYVQSDSKLPEWLKQAFASRKPRPFKVKPWTYREPVIHQTIVSAKKRHAWRRALDRSTGNPPWRKMPAQEVA